MVNSIPDKFNTKRINLNKNIITINFDIFK